MSAPLRWKEGGSAADPALRELLHHAGELTPDEAARLAALTERVLAQLPAPPPLPSPDAPAAAAAKLALGTKLTALVAGALLCGAALWIALREPAGEARIERGAASSMPRAEPSAPQRAAVKEDVDAPVAPPAATTPQPSLPQVARTRARTRAMSVTPHQPRDELSLLHDARRLRRVDPAAALGVAREHESRYPDGAFREEREALIVELLLRTGQRAEGEARLTAFLGRYPHSAYAERVRGWLQRAAAGSPSD